MSEWHWVMDIPRDRKCPECNKGLWTSKEHLVHWSGAEWHLECLLDKLTRSPGIPLSPLEEFEAPNAGAPWGLLRP